MNLKWYRRLCRSQLLFMLQPFLPSLRTRRHVINVTVRLCKCTCSKLQDRRPAWWEQLPASSTSAPPRTTPTVCAQATQSRSDAPQTAPTVRAQPTQSWGDAPSSVAVSTESGDNANTLQQQHPLPPPNPADQQESLNILRCKFSTQQIHLVLPLLANEQ